LVLAELELWPNLLLAAKGQGVRVAIINGRMSDTSFPGYRRLRPLFARLLRQIDLIAAQSAESAERFRALGAPANRVHVTGSLKYDGAATDRNQPSTLALRQLAGFADDDIVFLAGSTQEPEEEYAVDIFRRLATEHPRLRLVLVPRHPERFDAVARLLDETNLSWHRRTELQCQPPAEPGAGGIAVAATSIGGSAQQPPAPPGVLPPRPILLVDTVGELGAWWGTASIAFVGGSFGSRGGQNMIEPAAYGAAVAFGPNTRNFRDVVAALLAANAALVVRDADDLESFVRRSLEEPAWAAAFGARAQAFVNTQLGATARTAILVESLLEAAPANRIAA
jgi:3-deoxy-D-manno-octulosonic-acid transferase